MVPRSRRNACCCCLFFASLISAALFGYFTYAGTVWTRACRGDFPPGVLHPLRAAVLRHTCCRPRRLLVCDALVSEGAAGRRAGAPLLSGALNPRRCGRGCDAFGGLHDGFFFRFPACFLLKSSL